MSSFSLISEKFIKETIVSFILFPKHSGVKCSAYMPITWWVLWTSFCFFSEPNGSHRQLNFWFLSRSVSVVWHSTFWSVISVPVSDRLAWFFLFPTHWWLTIWHIFSIWCGWTVLFCFRSSYLAFTGFWKGIFLLFTHSVWALPFFLITISVLCCVFFLFFISVPSVQYRKSDWSVIFLYFSIMDWLPWLPVFFPCSFSCQR